MSERPGIDVVYQENRALEEKITRLRAERDKAVLTAMERNTEIHDLRAELDKVKELNRYQAVIIKGLDRELNVLAQQSELSLTFGLPGVPKSEETATTDEGGVIKCSSCGSDRVFPFDDDETSGRWECHGCGYDWPMALTNWCCCPECGSDQVKQDGSEADRSVTFSSVIDPVQERQLIVVDVCGEPLDLGTFMAALDKAQEGSEGQS